jgi:hypothetical protein
MDMIIDCDRCTVRGAACANCAVTFVTEDMPARAPAPSRMTGAAPARDSRAKPGPAARPANVTMQAGKSRDAAAAGKPPAADGSAPVIELDAAEIRALAALANAGLIPPLRYAPRMAKAS